MHHSRHLSCINSVEPCNTTMRCALWLAPFCLWGDGGEAGFRNLPMFPTAEKWQNCHLSSGISLAPGLGWQQPSSEMRNQWMGLVSRPLPSCMGISLIYFLGPGVPRRQGEAREPLGGDQVKVSRSNSCYTWDIWTWGEGARWKGREVLWKEWSSVPICVVMGNTVPQGTY